MGSEEQMHALDAQVAAGQVSMDEYLRRRAALLGTEGASQTAQPTDGPAGPGVPPPPLRGHGADLPGAPNPGGSAVPSATAFAGQHPPRSWQAAAPVSPLDPPSGNAEATRARPETNPLSPTGPPGSNPAQPAGARSRDWTPPTTPVTSSGGRGKSKTGVVAAVAALVAAAVFGASGYLLGSSGKSSDPAPTPSGSTSSGITPLAPQVAAKPPFPGVKDALTLAGGATGPTSRKLALLTSAVSNDENGALAKCGAEAGSVQTDIGATWTAHSWQFACTSPQAAADAVTDLWLFDQRVGLAADELKVASGHATSATGTSGTSIRIRYSSGPNILSTTVVAPDATQARAAADAVIAALVAAYPPR